MNLNLLLLPLNCLHSALAGQVQLFLVLLVLQLSILQRLQPFATATDFSAYLTPGSIQLTIWPNSSSWYELAPDDLHSPMLASSGKTCGDNQNTVQQETPQQQNQPAGQQQPLNQPPPQPPPPDEQAGLRQQKDQNGNPARNPANQQVVNLSCRNMDGDEVDWFIVIKSPRDNKGTEKYLYIDGANIDGVIEKVDPGPGGGPAPIKRTMLQQQNASAMLLGEAVKAALGNPADNAAFVAAYNDHFPEREKAHSSFGHMKGVVMLRINGRGFWLIHSVPRFPNFKKLYEFAPTGKSFGQSFICLNFAGSDLINIGHQLAISEPFYYYAIKNGLPVFELKKDIGSVENETYVENRESVRDAMLGTDFSAANGYRVCDIKSIGGTEFRHFAKRIGHDSEIYRKIADDIGSRLLVKSHKGNGSPIEDDINIKVNKVVFTVGQESISIGEVGNLRDHSKWCVAKSIEIAYVCIGDLNRTKTKKGQRGGGMLCLRNDAVSKIFRNAIKDPIVPKD